MTKKKSPSTVKEVKKNRRGRMSRGVNKVEAVGTDPYHPKAGKKSTRSTVEKAEHRAYGEAMRKKKRKKQ